jgi:hypothetical protein
MYILYLMGWQQNLSLNNFITTIFRSKFLDHLLVPNSWNCIGICDKSMEYKKSCRRFRHQGDNPRCIWLNDRSTTTTIYHMHTFGNDKMYANGT